VGAELGDRIVAPDETVQTRAARQQRGGAQRDVPAAYQQNPDHELTVGARDDRR
jgi:hypothetical protein